MKYLFLFTGLVRRNSQRVPLSREKKSAEKRKDAPGKNEGATYQCYEDDTETIPLFTVLYIIIK